MLKITIGVLVFLSFYPCIVFAGDPVQPARDHFLNEEYAKADWIYQAYSRQHELSYNDLVIWGVCRLRLGRPLEAASVFKLATKKDPEGVEAYLALGEIAARQTNYEEAAEYYDTALTLHPASEAAADGAVSARLNLGIQLVRKGDLSGAKEIATQALQIFDSSPEIFRLIGIIDLETGQIESAVAHLKRAADLEPNNPANFTLLARAYKAAGDTSLQKSALEEVTRLDPENPEPWARLGEIALESGDIRGVREYFGNAVDFGSRESLPYYWLARDRSAIPLLHLAIGNAIRESGTYQLQALKLLESHGGSITDENIEEIQALSDAAEEPLSLVRSALDMLREFSHSIDAYEKDVLMLADWYPYSLELPIALGELYVEQQRWDDAEAAWRKVLESNPSHGRAQIEMGSLLEKRGAYGGAAIFYRRALANDSSNNALYDAVERTYRAMGRYADVPLIFEDICRTETMNPLPHLRLAQVEQSLGNAEIAARWQARYKKIQELLHENR